MDLPLLVVAGANDDLAPPASVRPGFTRSQARDKTYRVLPLGHIDLLVGRDAPLMTWSLVTQLDREARGVSGATGADDGGTARYAPRHAALPLLFFFVLPAGRLSARIRATSSSSFRTVRRRSFTSSSVASAIAFATFSSCSRAKVCAFPGHAHGGHHRLHDPLVLHQFHDARVGHQLHTLLIRVFFRELIENPGLP